MKGDVMNWPGDFVDCIICGDCVNVMKGMPEQSVQCVVTSPPYYGLRAYAGEPQTWDDGWHGFLGLEPTPELYVKHLVSIFDEIKRVLKDNGTVWLNIGDTYNGNAGAGGNFVHKEPVRYPKRKVSTLKPKDLIMIPFRVALALQQAGWWVRSDIIWCLSGGTYVYASTQKGAIPMTIKDMARLDPATVELWDGYKWNQLMGISKSARQGTEIEFVLRSGERISCTPTHKFPTNRGLLDAKDIVVGDVLETTTLPEPIMTKDCALDEDAAWLAGLYIAEGSKAADVIQISGHSKEKSRLSRLTDIAIKYGGSLTYTIDGNNMSIRLYGKILNAIIDEFVSGRIAKNKCFAPVVWKYSNKFIESMLDGYLAGDGHWDEINNRWRIGFTRNYNLERDLRCACARLGYKITLKLSSVKYNGGNRPTFRGEIRKEVSKHLNVKNQAEVVEIRKARGKYFYDIGLASKPHLFALASGILTHNSKPNCMPSSAKDRPTNSHEHIFLLSKSKKYYYDADAIREPNSPTTGRWGKYTGSKTATAQFGEHGHNSALVKDRTKEEFYKRYYESGRNKRSVWSITTKPYKGAHFAVFPPELPETCIKAGTKPGDTVLDPFCGSGTTCMVAAQLNRNYVGIDAAEEYCELANLRVEAEQQQLKLL
jgi:DNA modification methylase